jgi:hypothetical protein
MAAMIAAASGGTGGLGDSAMALSDDPWIAEHSIIDPERLHALGIISAHWTWCERHLLVLFCVAFNLTGKVGRIIAHDIGDVSLSNKIREAMKTQAEDPEVSNMVGNFLDVYDVCRINRNALTHSVMKPIDHSFTNAVFTRVKGPLWEEKDLPSSLADIRRVAHEIHFVSSHSWDVCQAFRAHKQGEKVELPPLLIVPESLLIPPPHGSPKPKRSPKSSRRAGH